MDEQHTVTSTGFTFIKEEYVARDAIRAYLPCDIWLISLKQTNHVGWHYKAKFGSRRIDLSRKKVDMYIQRALENIDGGNFIFDRKQ